MLGVHLHPNSRKNALNKQEMYTIFSDNAAKCELYAIFSDSRKMRNVYHIFGQREYDTRIKDSDFQC